jgi:hypothetical protein
MSAYHFLQEIDERRDRLYEIEQKIDIDDEELGHLLREEHRALDKVFGDVVEIIEREQAQLRSSHSRLRG